MNTKKITAEVAASVLQTAQDAAPQESSLDHGQRVAEYCYLVAKKLSLSEKDCQKLKSNALYHDIGKALIPDSILEKPGSLTQEEHKQIQAHTTNGYSILKKAPDPTMRAAAKLALQHHENLDGSGYPFGISGDDIGIDVRILRVTDTYDAITSWRAYRKTRSSQEAIDIIKENSGNHYDPKVIAAFEDVLRERLELDFSEDELFADSLA